MSWRNKSEGFTRKIQGLTRRIRVWNRNYQMSFKENAKTGKHWRLNKENQPTFLEIKNLSGFKDLSQNVYLSRKNSGMIPSPKVGVMSEKRTITTLLLVDRSNVGCHHQHVEATKRSQRLSGKDQVNSKYDIYADLPWCPLSSYWCVLRREWVAGGCWDDD